MEAETEHVRIGAGGRRGMGRSGAHDHPEIDVGSGSARTFSSDATGRFI